MIPVAGQHMTHKLWMSIQDKCDIKNDFWKSCKSSLSIEDRAIKQTDSCSMWFSAGGSVELIFRVMLATEGEPQFTVRYSISHLMAFHFWLPEACIFQDLTRERAFPKLPLRGPPCSSFPADKTYRCGSGPLLNGIRANVQTGNIIWVHMFIKYKWEGY